MLYVYERSLLWRRRSICPESLILTVISLKMKKKKYMSRITYINSDIVEESLFTWMVCVPNHLYWQWYRWRKCIWYISLYICYMNVYSLPYDVFVCMHSPCLCVREWHVFILQICVWLQLPYERCNVILSFSRCYPLCCVYVYSQWTGVQGVSGNMKTQCGYIQWHGK